MLHIDFRLAEIRDRERRLRILAERERRWRLPRRGFRIRLGDLLVRFGRLLGGEEAAGLPAVNATTANPRLG
jgi:hypothetical protein